MNKGDKIYISGHNGMVGSAILRKLKSEGFYNLIYKNSLELDLRNQSSVESFFEIEKPDFVFLAAAKVGGIYANNLYRADFIYDNLMIEANLIHSSYLNKVKKLLFLGSSCIYPKNSTQPILEEYLLSGYLEHTNQPYAVAKICGIELCDSYRAQYNCNFISAMPTNLYGPNDNYDLNTAHVLPALMRKFIEAKELNNPSVKIWGTGKPMREFMHVDDLAEACLFLMNNYNEGGIVNVGTGVDISIFELAFLIKEIVGFEGDLEFDSQKPDGTFKKLLDVSKINSLGWSSKIELSKGLSLVYNEVKNADFNSFK
jgi:GDP-L-fucose synthase